MHETHSRQPRGRARLAAGLLAAAACLAISFATVAHAQPLPPTTVAPPGDYFQAVQVGSSTFSAGGSSVTCNTSVSAPTAPLGTDNRNQVPLANVNPSGPITGPINPPSFTSNGGSCPTSIPLTRATVTTSGNWQLSAQGGPSPTATLVIPAGGIRIQTSGLASCTVTNTATTSVTGSYTNGSGGGAGTLTFSGATVSNLRITGGFGCPTSATSGTFTGTYSITDVSNPGASITIT